MAYEIIITDTVRKDFNNVAAYLEKEWSFKVAKEFVDAAMLKINLLSVMPNIGVQSSKDTSIKRILITKHNFLFYRIEVQTVILLNLVDTRQEI